MENVIRKIEEGILTQNETKNFDDKVVVFEAIRDAINADVDFVVPVDVPEGFAGIDFNNMSEGDFVNTQADIDFSARTLRSTDGSEWIVCFTSVDELKKGAATAVISQKAGPLLDMVLNTDSRITGLLFNPWGVPFFLPKDVIAEIFKQNRTPKSTISLAIGNIATLECHCIVNAANESLLGGGGVDGAIHLAAGPDLLDECKTLNGCKTGEAKLTKGYNLKAEYIIHTVGPKYSGAEEDAALLRACYINSLNLAKENNIHSIAFPAISTGAYGYPKEEATDIAIKAVTEWLGMNSGYVISVIFCCLDQDTHYLYADKLTEIM